MKVFLSWSGPKSKAVAEILRDWLPNVIQALEPWMSSEDIDKGAAWDAEIARSLADSKAGVVCVTPENQNAPWLNFEAGALSHVVSKTMVCTYLVGIRAVEVTGPLSRFQATEADEEHTRKLIGTLNKALGELALTESKLNSSFCVWWPSLEKKLKDVPLTWFSEGAARSTNDLLEEILLLTRNLAKQSESTQRKLFSDEAAMRHWIASPKPSLYGPQPTLLTGQGTSAIEDYLRARKRAYEDESLKGEPSVGTADPNSDKRGSENMTGFPRLNGEGGRSKG